MLYVASVRVPKWSKEVKSTIDYSRLPKDLSEIKIVREFSHQGEVSKARAMKQDWKQIASILNTGEIAIYHYDKPESVATLRGLEEEGFGIAWNPHQGGQLGGATGQRICIWDVSQRGPASIIVNGAHEKVINDIKFSTRREHLFGTCSDDGHFKLWDARSLKDARSFTQCN
jgi:histone-binding protein RBBP4